MSLGRSAVAATASIGSEARQRGCGLPSSALVSFRQPNQKTGSSAAILARAVRLNGAAHLRDHSVHDPQTQSGAFLSLSGEEKLELREIFAAGIRAVVSKTEPRSLLDLNSHLVRWQCQRIRLVSTSKAFDNRFENTWRISPG